MKLKNAKSTMIESIKNYKKSPKTESIEKQLSNVEDDIVASTDPVMVDALKQEKKTKATIEKEKKEFAPVHKELGKMTSDESSRTRIKTVKTADLKAMGLVEKFLKENFKSTEIVENCKVKVANRKLLGKLVENAKALNIKHSISRLDEDGYRYLFTYNFNGTRKQSKVFTESFNPIKEDRNDIDVETYKAQWKEALNQFRAAYGKVTDMMLSYGYDCNEFINTKEARECMDNSFAPISLDELAIADWCFAVEDALDRWTPGTYLEESKKSIKEAKEEKVVCEKDGYKLVDHGQDGYVVVSPDNVHYGIWEGKTYGPKAKSSTDVLIFMDEDAPEYEYINHMFGAGNSEPEEILDYVIWSLGNTSKKEVKPEEEIVESKEDDEEIERLNNLKKLYDIEPGDLTPEEIEDLRNAGMLEESKELKEEPIYGLDPQYDARNSFYGKAQVEINNGVQTLYSYNTKVAEISKDGKVTLFDAWNKSQTTLRHVKEFLKQNGYKADSLKQMTKDYVNECIKEYLEPISSFKTFEYANKTNQGHEIVKMFKEKIKTEKGDDYRVHVISKNPHRDSHAYAVGLGYSLDNGYWNQGWYDYETPEEAEKDLKANYKVEPYSPKKVEESLNEDVKIICDLSDYKPWSGAVDVWERIVQEDKVDELDFMLEDIYPEGITMTELNDLLWFDTDWVFDMLGIGEESENIEDDEEFEEGVSLPNLNVNIDASGQSVGLLGGTGGTVTNEDINLNLDASGQSVGILNGQGGQVVNENEYPDTEEGYVVFAYEDEFGDGLVDTKGFKNEKDAIRYADRIVNRFARVEIIAPDGEKIY